MYVNGTNNIVLWNTSCFVFDDLQSFLHVNSSYHLLEHPVQASPLSLQCAADCYCHEYFGSELLWISVRARMPPS